MHLRYLVLGTVIACLISIPFGLRVIKGEEMSPVTGEKTGSVKVQVKEYDLNLPDHYKLTEKTVESYIKKGVVSYGKKNPMYIALAETEEYTGSESLSKEITKPSENETKILSGLLQDMMLPVDPEYFNITSEYGNRQHPINGNKGIHRGIDIASEGIENQPVYAVMDGVVEYAGPHKVYGNMVRIAHNDGEIKSIYAHLKEIPDDIYPTVHVKKGRIIGRVGNTGLSTGPHLHFELRAPVNPDIFLSLKGVE